MEVAATNDIAIFENKRIVGDAVDLSFDDTRRIIERVAARAMYLRHAAQAVGILHFAAVAMRFEDFALLEQRPDIGSSTTMTGVLADLMNSRIERLDAALQRFERHCGDEVELLDEVS